MSTNVATITNDQRDGIPTDTMRHSGMRADKVEFSMGDLCSVSFIGIDKAPVQPPM